MRRLILLTIAACVWLAPAASSASDEVTGHKPTSKITEFDFSQSHSGPSVVQADSDGSVWVALARTGKVAQFQRDGGRKEFNLPDGSFPVGIAKAKEQRLYVSDIRRNVIVQVDTTNGATKDYAIPTKNAWPFFLSISSNGHIWFTERVGNNIGELDPTTSVVREYRVPTEQAQPAGLTITPDDNIYFSENTGHKIGHLDPKVGRVIELKLPSVLQNSPYYGLAGIAAEDAKTVWFAELDGRLGKIERRSGVPDHISEVLLPNQALRPAGVAVDQWGIIWFTELDGNAIGSYNPKLHVFDHFPIPTGSPDPAPMGPPEATARGEMPLVGLRARTSRPFGIAVDALGRVWFSEQYAGKVGRLDVPVIRIFAPTGRITSLQTAVTLQLRTAHNSTVNFKLNGMPIPAGQTIELLRAAGGKNELRVSISGDASSEATTSFIYDPTLDAVRESLERQLPPSSNRSELESQVLSRLRQATAADRTGHPDQARAIQQELISVLSSNGLSEPSLDAALGQLRWKDRFGSHDHLMTVEHDVNKKPLIIEVGDSVEWKPVEGASRKKLEIVPCNSDSEALPYSAVSPSRVTFHKSGHFTYALGSNEPCFGEVHVIARTMAIEEFPLPDKDSVPGVLSVDPQGNVWFTEGGGGYSKLAAVPLNNKIGCLKTDGTIQQYPTPTQESAPTSIHVGTEGHIWFTERAGNNLGELIPETGAVVEYPIPTPNSGTTGITVDHKGTIWFASKGSSKIGYLEIATKKLIEISTPTPNSQPSTITVDDDNNIWFDERAQDKIVRYERATGNMTEFSVPTKGSRVVGLVPDHDGNIFFLELGANKVGHLQVATGQIREYTIPTPFSSPFKEALDSDGRLWFTEVFGNKVGMLDNGVFTEYEIPTPDAMPGGITIDMRGNIWFSEQAGNKIAKIPSLLTISRFAVYGDPDRDHGHHHTH